MNWNRILNQITSISEIAEIIAIIFSVFFALGIIILFFKARAFFKESWLMSFRGIDIPQTKPGKIRRKWHMIEKRLNSRDETNYKMAVIEADKLLDRLLELAGYSGKSMGERLKQLTPAQISNLDAIWRAHKLRNNIVHDIDRKIKYNNACQAIEAFKKALEELEVL